MSIIERVASSVLAHCFGPQHSCPHKLQGVTLEGEEDTLGSALLSLRKVSMHYLYPRLSYRINRFNGYLNLTFWESCRSYGASGLTSGRLVDAGIEDGLCGRQELDAS